MPTVRVLGLGNVLMGDDALGPYVLRVLEAAYRPPEGVQFQEIGTPGLSLIPYVAGAEVLIIVDSVRGGGPAGEVRLFGLPQILEHLSRPRLGPHDPGLREALFALQFAGGGPRELLLIGVVPQRCETGVGLSPDARRAVPVAVDAVVRALAERGFHPTRRTPPASPDIWWERPAGGDVGRDVEAACTR